MNGEGPPQPSTEKWRERLERVLRFSVLVFVLAAAGFLSAVTTIRIAIRGRIVSMPNLVGQAEPGAQHMLAVRGLQLRVADRVYSPMPVNTIVRQSPPPGEEMKISQDAHVVLSLGPQTVKIPALEGQSMRAARMLPPIILALMRGAFSRVIWISSIASSTDCIARSTGT